MIIPVIVVHTYFSVPVLLLLGCTRISKRICFPLASSREILNKIYGDGTLLHRSAERSLSEAMAQKVKAERAKCLLKARVTALSRGFQETSNNYSSAGGGRREARPTASDPLSQRPDASTSSSCSSSSPFRRGGDVVDPETVGGAGAASASDALRADGRGQGDRESKRTNTLGEDTQAQPPQGGSKVPGPPPEGHPGQEPEAEKEPGVTVTDGQGKGRDRGRGRGQLERGEERLVDQAVERERRRFEAERQVLERQRQEADQAAGRAKARAEELNSAWRALADKVVSLANRNADLEWVSSGREEGDGRTMKKSERSRQYYSPFFGTTEG